MSIHSSKRKYIDIADTNNAIDTGSAINSAIDYTNNNINDKIFDIIDSPIHKSQKLNNDKLLSSSNNNNALLSPIKNNNTLLSPNKNNNSLFSPNRNNNALLSPSKASEFLKSPSKINKQLYAAQTGIKSPEIKGMVSVTSMIPPSPLVNINQNLSNVVKSINKLASKIIDPEVIDIIITSFNNVFHTTNTSNLLVELADKSSNKELEVFELEAQRKNIFNLLNVTINSMSSCSIMLSGPKHSGKTYTLKYVLNQLRNKCNTDGKTGFVTVELNGYLHNDELVALKEIERQLAGETILKNRSKSVNSIVNSMEYLKLLLQETKQVGLSVVCFKFNIFFNIRYSFYIISLYF